MGASLEKHKDTITRGERQFRLLIVLKEALRGGELICPTYIFNFRRLRLFEPCSHEHEVTLVEEGERLVILAGIRYGRFVLSPPF